MVVTPGGRDASGWGQFHVGAGQQLQSILERIERGSFADGSLRTLLRCVTAGGPRSAWASAACLWARRLGGTNQTEGWLNPPWPQCVFPEFRCHAGCLLLCSHHSVTQRTLTAAAGWLDDPARRASYSRQLAALQASQPGVDGSHLLRLQQLQYLIQENIAQACLRRALEARGVGDEQVEAAGWLGDSSHLSACPLAVHPWPPACLLILITCNVLCCPGHLQAEAAHEASAVIAAQRGIALLPASPASHATLCDVHRVRALTGVEKARALQLYREAAATHGSHLHAAQSAFFLAVCLLESYSHEAGKSTDQSADQSIWPQPCWLCVQQPHETNRQEHLRQSNRSADSHPSIASMQASLHLRGAISPPVRFVRAMLGSKHGFVATVRQLIHVVLHCNVALQQSRIALLCTQDEVQAQVQALLGEGSAALRRVSKFLPQDWIQARPHRPR